VTRLPSVGGERSTWAAWADCMTNPSALGSPPAGDCVLPGSTMRILSLDIPWGGGTYVGAAAADVRDGQLAGPPTVTSVHSSKAPAIPLPPLPVIHPEIAGFIADGAGPGRARATDMVGPFNAFPHTPVARQAYLSRLWAAFHSITLALKDFQDAVDLLLVDMPPVPAALALAYQAVAIAAQFRPVELAFHNCVLVPGASAGRPDGRIQFAKFQAGIINGCRPAYAVFEMARQVFGGTVVVESFPQLVLGAVTEFASAQGLALIHRLAGHKSGNAAAMNVSQHLLGAQIATFLGGIIPQWVPDSLTPRERADGYDALLGLLPGLAHAGFVPPANAPSPWQRAVLLRNLSPPLPPWPVATGAGLPATGCRQWIQTAPAFGAGVDDSGILCLDLALWG
jgi:hypothetical protein